MTHHLKILPQYFEEVAEKRKEFEIRKNDRNYKVTDNVALHEWDGEEYTGRVVQRGIKYIYHGDGNYGLAEGYCVLGLCPCRYPDYERSEEE